MNIETLYNWEKLQLAGIIYVMVKWMDFHDVQLHTNVRDNVESGVWFEVQVRGKQDNYLWTVSSQNLSLLKERLIKKLDHLGLREDYLKTRAAGQTET